MKSSKEKVISITPGNVFNKIMPIIKKSYKKYEYLGLSFEDYSELIKERLINKIRQLDDNTDITESFFEKQINSIVGSYIKEKLSTGEWISLVNGYINKAIKYSDDYSKVVQQLKKINNFFSKLKIMPDPDLCIELIKSNKKLSDILDKFTKRNIVSIKGGNIDGISPGIGASIFIETYCVLEGILDEDAFINDLEKTIKATNLTERQTLDSVRMYLHEIDLPLLSREEEILLAQQIANGDAEARQLLAERNLKLVVSIAKRYKTNSISLLDLIGYGNIGLMRAIDKYDLSKGVKFGTYATWWIKQSIRRSLQDYELTIKIPVNISENMEKLYKELQRKPTTEEISKYLNLPYEKAAAIYNAYKKPLSTNMKISENENNEIETLIFSDEQLPEDIIAAKSLSESMSSLFSNANLIPKEISVLTLRYGLNGNGPMSLKKIANIYGVTNERIRQIESNAFKKIRKAKYTKRFASYAANPTRAIENLAFFKQMYEQDDLNFSGRRGQTYKKYLSDGIPARDKMTEFIKEAITTDLQMKNDLGTPVETEVVAGMFGVTPSEVREITKQTLLNYSEKLNAINEDISSSKTTNANQLVKTGEF